MSALGPFSVIFELPSFVCSRGQSWRAEYDLGWLLLTRSGPWHATDSLAPEYVPRGSQAMVTVVSVEILSCDGLPVVDETVERLS